MPAQATPAVDHQTTLETYLRLLKLPRNLATDTLQIPAVTLTDSI